MTGRPVTATHVPYRLHRILHTRRIPHADLCAVIRFAAGRRTGQPISAATMSSLLLRRVWPSTIEAETIQTQVAEFLRSREVPEAEIAECWLPDGDVEDAGPPLGRPLLSVGRHDRVIATDTDNPPEPPFEIPEAEMLSSLAKELFRLPRHPFVDDVQCAEDVFLSADQRYIRESMYYAAKHSGFVAIVGESGSGKSTLRRDLIERIRRNDEAVVVIQPQTIDKRTLTAAHICDAIIADMSGERPKLSLEAKSRQVKRILAGSARAGNAHALIIEEAHDLSLATLKYLKRFWELEDGFRKLLGIVLIGQTELGLRLNERHNPDAREVIRRCEVATLRPLNGNLEQYLDLKFRRIGADAATVFAADAYDAIRARLSRRRQGSNEVESNVYPLSVHNVVIKAMNIAADIGRTCISADLIGRV